MNTYWIKNVLLETGVEALEYGAEKTLAEKFDIKIENKKIVEIAKAGERDYKGLKTIDAKGLLMVPAFTEKHCHIDKALMGDAWRAVTKTNSVLERAENEKRIIPFMKTTTMDYRSRQMIDNFIKNGSTTIRTHVDIYPEVGISQFHSVKETLESYRDKIDYEIVAFPQHGLLKSDAGALVEEAMKAGADYVGGVDPNVVDNDMERSLRQTFEIAVKYGKGIDYHLHERHEEGLSAIWRIIELTAEYGLQNQVDISHGFAFRDISGNEREELCTAAKEAGITLISHVPLNGNVPELSWYYDQGMKIALGSDNIFDCWSPFGNGDMLERLNRYSEMFVRRTESELRENLNLITGYKTPLDRQGDQVWPKAGDRADFILVDASCTAEMTARRSVRRAVFHNGYELYNQIEN